MERTTFEDVRDQRVLITGGLGFIGSNLAIRCVEAGAEVTVYDCLDPRSGGNLFNIDPIKEQARCVVNDIRNFEALASAVRDHDVVFNCAAYTSHPNSMKDPLNDIDVNCKGVINLLESIRRFNPDVRLVHVGTSTQIGRMHYTPIDEHHPEFPADIYSANKVAAEKYVLIYAQAYGIRGSVIRLANTYGPRSNLKSPDFGFINYFIGLALADKEIPVFGKGEQLRTMTYVDDAVQALLLATADQATGRTYFACDAQRYSVAELAQSIVDVMGTGRVRFVPWPKDREVIEIGDAVISNDQIRKDLGWQPIVDLREGLARTHAYFEPCLTKYAG